MAIPTVYRWDDANAPVLSGTAGSLISLLTACLVNGYDVKTAAGWTKEFENVDGTIAAFRNSTANGNGVYLRVDDTGTTTAQVQAFEAMTDENSGLGPFLTVGSSYSIRKSVTADTAARPWAVVATDTFFYLIIKPQDTSPIPPEPRKSSFLCCGDFNAAHEDGYNSMIGYSYVTHSIEGFTIPSFDNARAGLSCSRPLSGTADTPINLWCSWGGPGSWGDKVYADVYNGANLTVLRPAIGDDNSRALRGFMPGLLVPCHNFDQWTTLDSEIITDATSGRSFFVLKIDGCFDTAYYYNSNSDAHVHVFLIEIGEWNA